MILGSPIEFITEDRTPILIFPFLFLEYSTMRSSKQSNGQESAVHISQILYQLLLEVDMMGFAHEKLQIKLIFQFDNLRR